MAYRHSFGIELQYKYICQIYLGIIILIFICCHEHVEALPSRSNTNDFIDATIVNSESKHNCGIAYYFINSNEAHRAKSGEETFSLYHGVPRPDPKSPPLTRPVASATEFASSTRLCISHSHYSEHHSSSENQIPRSSSFPLFHLLL